MLKEIVDKVDTSLHSRQAVNDSFTITQWLQTGSVASLKFVSVCRSWAGQSHRAGLWEQSYRKNDYLDTLPHTNTNPEESQSLEERSFVHMDT